MSNTITKGQVGILAYTLKNDAGEVLDQANAGHPLAYLHGHGNIIPGLENALEGKAQGDTLTVTLAPADAYGEKIEMDDITVKRSEFPKQVRDRLGVGMPIPVQGSNGQNMTLFITKLEGSIVSLTPNHPLAGETLHFDVEVIGVRTATPDEVTHGHAHGPAGTHHHH